MYYSPTIISLIEVVLVLVPALVGIAYVTVAERKTMASMQRRLGPNHVGQIQILFKRSYHNSSHLPNEEKFISDLDLNRKALVTPFKDNVISVCEDLKSSDAMNTFFKDLKGIPFNRTCSLVRSANIRY